MRDKYLKIAFKLVENETWLVGGLLRDMAQELRITPSKRDYDLTTREKPETLARKLKGQLGGTIVILREGEAVRLVTSGGPVFDLALLASPIEDNLAERDYTINALAWCPEHGMLDKMNSLEDITMRKIRVISRDNLISDPLRIIRAYRMMAITGFRITTETRRVLAELSELCIKPANERITFEILKIISSEYHLLALKCAEVDGVLTQISGLSDKQLDWNLKLVKAVGGNFAYISNRWLATSAQMDIDNASMVRLSALMIGAKDDRLTLSTDAQGRIGRSSDLFLQAKNISRWNRAAIYDLLDKSRGGGVDLALLTGNMFLSEEQGTLNRMRKRPIVSAADLMECGYAKGPKLGRGLKSIERLKFISPKTNKRDLLKSLGV